MAVFGYGRVSTAEQTTDNQRLEIERAWYLVEYWYADTVSGRAHATQRKQFNVLLGKLRARDTVRLPDPHQAQIATMMESSMAPCGSGILQLLVCQSPRWRFNKVPLGIPRGSGNLTVVVSKLDRLGRDAPDVLSTIKLLTTLGVEVVVLQLGKLDLASTPGKLMLTMLAAIAEMERDLIVERTQAGLSRAKAEGKVLGRPAKTTPQQRKAMVDAYEKKASVSSLARLYGISRATVLKVVKHSPELELGKS